MDFQRALLDRKAGDKLAMTVVRKGSPLTLNLKLAEVPEPSKPAAGLAWDVLGLELKAIPAADFRQKYQSRYRGGLMVTDVRPGQSRGGPRHPVRRRAWWACTYGRPSRWRTSPTF